MKDKKTKSKRRGRKYPRKRTSKKTIAKGKKKNIKYEKRVLGSNMVEKIKKKKIMILRL